MEAVRDLLEAAGREERAALERARLCEDPVGISRVASVLGPRLRGRVAGPRRRLIWVAVAAAALLALFAWGAWPDPGERARDPGERLGTGSARALHPVGEVSSFTPFAWEGLPDGGFQVIRVHRGDAPPGERPLIEVNDYRRTRWNPDSDLVARWPDRIRWEVEIRDAAGQWVGSIEATARRR